MVYIINELIYNRKSLPIYMKNIHFVLMPIVNPDGYTYSYENDRLWRKNRVETYNKNCIGIDLNRNWNYDWYSINSDENYCSENYQGTAPNSELEIKAIIQFINKNLAKIKGFITLHSYGQAIVFPWAYTKDHLKIDYDKHQNIATSMSLKIFEKTSNTYTVGPASTVLYKASGTSMDWMKGIANIRYVFTLELRDTGINGFNLPTSEIIPSGQEAFCAVSVLAKVVESDYQSKSTLCRSKHFLFSIMLTIYYFN
ncbi:carboxypeptidase B-like [Rhopalosiphum maidis]|uniref:carboxypeptidase B-like n=1 Tax=Rhopalosiphum maidis TaxID=43146 RepID=UPI000F0096C6|nr:carboxypeptidase B-like [Rhopalosiphum maidis]